MVSIDVGGLQLAQFFFNLTNRFDKCKFCKVEGNLECEKKVEWRQNTK